MQFISYVRSCVYLEATINEKLTDDQEIEGRTLKAVQLCGMLRKQLVASKDAWPVVKKMVFEGMIIPTLLDGAEHWVVNADKKRELNTTYNSMVRSALRFTTYTTRKYRITSKELHEKLALENLDCYLDMRVLGYAGHVQRMGPERLPKQLRDSFLLRPQKRGRPYKTHNDQVRECMKRKGIELADWKLLALNKTKWRAAIRAPSVYQTKSSSGRYSEWLAAPESLHGVVVEKKYGSKWFEGTITGHDLDADTNETIWRVLYDDGDMGDYNCHQLNKIICDDDF